MPLLIAHNENAPEEQWDLEVLAHGLAQGARVFLLGGTPSGELARSLEPIAFGETTPSRSASLQSVEARLGIPIAAEVELLERLQPSVVLTSSRLPTLIAARLLGIPCCVRTPAFHHPLYHLAPIHVRPDLHEARGHRILPLRWKRTLLARSWSRSRTLVRRLSPCTRELNIDATTTDLSFGLGDLAILREPPEVLPPPLAQSTDDTLLLGPHCGWQVLQATREVSAGSKKVLLHVSQDVALGRALERALRGLAERWEFVWSGRPTGLESTFPEVGPAWKSETWDGVACAILLGQDFYVWQAWRHVVPVIGIYRHWAERAALEDLSRTGMAVFFDARRIRSVSFAEYLADAPLDAARSNATFARDGEDRGEALRDAVRRLRS